MNSYTHSGFRQLSRRFNGGRIAANYSEDEIKEVIVVTTMAVVLLGRLFCVVIQKHEPAEEANTLIERLSES